MNLKVAERLLGRNYSVDTAVSGKDAIEKLTSDGVVTDLILLDIHIRS